MWVQETTVPQNNGMVIAITDASEFVEVDGSRTTLVSSKAYEVYTNNRTLVYDSTYRYWTEYDKGASSWSWWSSDEGELFGGLGSAGFVDQWDTTATTDTGSVAITATWRSGWIQAASGQRIIAVYVHMESGTESSITVNVYKDFLTTVDATATMTPSQARMYRIGLRATRGHAHQVELTGTAMGKINRIEIEYEAA